MLLSVLLPARDAATTIEHAVSSTLRALPSDAELLVLDDGSKDNTAALVRGFADPRVKLFTSSESSGLANGLNALLDEAQGTLVSRMDADDVTLPGRFQTQIRQLKMGVDVTFGGVIHFGEKLRFPYPSPPLSISPNAFATALLIANPVAHSTMTARRGALASLGGYRDCTAEDYDLWIRAAQSGLRLNRIARPVIALRRHHRQVTAAPNWSSRALRDPLWRTAFAELSRSTLGVHETQGLQHEMEQEVSCAPTHEVLGHHLQRAIKRQSPTDRMALLTLLRRVQRQYQER